MELKQFIVGAISDIAEATKEADILLKELGGLANPGTHIGVGSTFVAPRTTLNFDIAVSAGTEGSKGAGVKARIWVVEASVDGEKTKKDETVSRLTFSVDVVLPHDPRQSERVGKVKSPE